MLHGRASGPSTCILALGQTILARDVTALSRPNGGIRLVANKPCSSRVDGGDGVQGTLSSGTAKWWPLYWLAVSVTASGRKVVGPSTRGSSYPVWGGDHAAAVGQR